MIADNKDLTLYEAIDMNAFTMQGNVTRVNHFISYLFVLFLID